MAQDRPLRADARRNRARVLAAAQEAFAAEGVVVPLDEIARRAGVGAGTVYRHFPTKEALFEAVVADRLEALAEDGRKALAEPDAGKAFYDFLAHVMTDADQKRDLADALTRAGVELQASTREAAAALSRQLALLLSRAQDAAAVRSDIDVVDLHAIVLGALAAERHRGDPSRPGRISALVTDALRPSAASYNT